MSGLPQDLTEAWWGTDRALPIVHALDALLDQMERRLEDDEPEAVGIPADLLPLSTGLLPLDRVLGGGIWRGTVTFVEADIEAQGAALLNTVARHVPHRCLLDGRRFFALVAGLLAGSAGVPQVSVTDACLSEREWASVVSGLEQLRGRDVLVCSTGSLAALANVARSTEADVLLVHDPGRFGRPIEFVPELAKVASSGRVAVLASASPMGDLPEWATDGVTRLGMHGFDLGGRASLVRPDPDELLAVAQIDVECLRGIVR
jgi:hypothetical protein